MDSSNPGLNYMLVRYISEYLIGFPKSTTFDHLTLIRTYVDICQHQFFSFDCTRPLYASSVPFADQGKLIISFLLH